MQQRYKHSEGIEKQFCSKKLSLREILQNRPKWLSPKLFILSGLKEGGKIEQMFDT